MSLPWASAWRARQMKKLYDYGARGVPWRLCCNVIVKLANEARHRPAGSGWLRGIGGMSYRRRDHLYVSILKY
eukprot:COSAG02_NODE_2306_length_9174_cov_10.715152_5_plen_73_part_00